MGLDYVRDPSHPSLVQQEGDYVQFGGERSCAAARHTHGLKQTHCQKLGAHSGGCMKPSACVKPAAMSCSKVSIGQVGWRGSSQDTSLLCPLQSTRSTGYWWTPTERT